MTSRILAHALCDADFAPIHKRYCASIAGAGKIHDLGVFNCILPWIQKAVESEVLSLESEECND